MRALNGDEWHRRPDASPAAGPELFSGPPPSRRKHCQTWERNGARSIREPTTGRCLRPRQWCRQRLFQPTEAKRRRTRGPDSKKTQLCRKPPSPLPPHTPTGHIRRGDAAGAGSGLSARIGTAARALRTAAAPEAVTGTAQAWAETVASALTSPRRTPTSAARREGGRQPTAAAGAHSAQSATTCRDDACVGRRRNAS